MAVSRERKGFEHGESCEANDRAAAGRRRVTLVTSPLDALPVDVRRALIRGAPPEWISPMLATLTERRFSGPDWLFERKFDGVRVLAFRRGGETRLLSRNRKPVDAHYPEVAEALADQPERDLVLDGEVVAFEGSQTSFARLQQRMQLADADRARRTGVRIFYYVFDLPYADGFDLTRVSLRARKAMLRRSLVWRDPVRFTPHRNAAGEAFWREACRKGWEGVMAKRIDSTYESRRSPDWLKFKCVSEQEFVVGGYTDPKGSRSGFGALLVGTYQDAELVYAGKVGTGFNEQTLANLSARMQALETDRAPFARGAIPKRDAHWIRPELVAQIGFTEWTRDGQLRHPRFLGLRTDKDPREVVRERPS
jgi:bifunctional non-homologous end joining protein LigD